MKISHLLPMLLLLAFPTVHAAGEQPDGYRTCVACHGATGEGNLALNAPALAGQDAAYLERQLQNFRSGLRGTDAKDTYGAQMRPMALALSDDDGVLIAAWLAEQRPPVHAPAAGADLKNGNDYYQAKCGACHGGKAQGNAGLNSPALSLLDAAYLQRQFSHFQQGIRGSHADDKFGRQMTLMSKTLPGDQDLVDVIAYIHAQGGAE